MNPVTGPIRTHEYTGGASNSTYKDRSKYKQVKPYNLNLPYTLLYRATTANTIGTPPLAWTFGGSLNSPLDPDNGTGDIYFATIDGYRISALNSAIKKFSKGAGDRASMGVAMAQHREAFSMIEKRAIQLFSLVKSLRRFDLKGACKALGLSLWQAKKRHREWVRQGKGGPYTLSNEDIWQKDWNKTKTRERWKTFSGLWLEFSFGWAPFVDDVRNAVQIVSTKPELTSSLKTRGGQGGSFTASSVTQDQNYKYERLGVHTSLVRVSIGGTLTVNNENYSLASRLGLTSLSAIAYEVTPFSFVFNYFVNIEEWLAQYSSFEGVTVSQAWYTIRWEDSVAHETWRTTKFLPGTPRLLQRSYVQKVTHVRRVVGSLPVTQLQLRPSYHNGIKRALNNVSLLLQLGIKAR